MLAPPQYLHLLLSPAVMLTDAGAPVVLASDPPAAVLADSGAPAVLALAPDAVILADAGTPAVLALALLAVVLALPAFPLDALSRCLCLPLPPPRRPPPRAPPHRRPAAPPCRRQTAPRGTQGTCPAASARTFSLPPAPCPRFSLGPAAAGVTAPAKCVFITAGPITKLFAGGEVGRRLRTALMTMMPFICS